jgi:hypothetical protein
MFSFCSIHTASRSFEDIYLVIAVGGAGSGVCGSGLINRALGAPQDSASRALRPVRRELSCTTGRTRPARKRGPSVWSEAPRKSPR